MTKHWRLKNPILNRYPTFSRAVQICFSSLYICALTGLPLGAAREITSAENKSELSVTLSVSKKTNIVGAVLQVKVQISNEGSDPFLIPNSLSLSRNSTAHLEFKLRDQSGKESPMSDLIADNFTVQKSQNPSSALLGDWVLLRPGYSLVRSISLDKHVLEFLGKPGVYRLSGTYFANSLSYPPIRNQMGLTDNDVKSLPFNSWSGNISTNAIEIRLVPAKSMQIH